ncbi:UNKNOWN [Stylonychia lemnae]|uniref:Uncharacterized protein n=1 Tax=Stylonychia lemnae TaxID=5949 RepID=A0A078AYQ9_STYLE|nr:UNKNOWN [Stylonychia lemnae]|eukprot:CDW87271.1 UNKNOWN [Stylonychia lemnae]
MKQPHASMNQNLNAKLSKNLNIKNGDSRQSYTHYIPSNPKVTHDQENRNNANFGSSKNQEQKKQIQLASPINYTQSQPIHSPNVNYSNRSQGSGINFQMSSARQLNENASNILANKNQQPNGAGIGQLSTGFNSSTHTNNNTNHNNNYVHSQVYETADFYPQSNGLQILDQMQSNVMVSPDRDSHYYQIKRLSGNQDFNRQSQDGVVYLSNGHQSSINSNHMASNDSQYRHFNLLKQQELQIMREKEKLLYGSKVEGQKDNINVYSTGAGGRTEPQSDGIFPISETPSEDYNSNRNRLSQDINDIKNSQQKSLYVKNFRINGRTSNASDQLIENDNSCSKLYNDNYEFLTQSHDSQQLELNSQMMNQSQINQFNNFNNQYHPQYQHDHNSQENQHFNRQLDFNQYEEDLNTVEDDNHIEEEEEQDFNDEDINDNECQSEIDDEQQRALQESLALSDQEFNENLNMLYQRRINSTKKYLDTILIELQKSQTQSEYIQNMRSQLQNNKDNLISELKIRHHMLVLKLDEFLEKAMDEIFSNESNQEKILEDHYRKQTERTQELEALCQIIELKIQKEKKTKFVQYYPDMIKEFDKIMDKFQNQENQREVDQSLQNLEMPHYDYMIVSQSDYDSALNHRTQNLIIDKSVQCNLDARMARELQAQKQQLRVPEIIISDTHSQNSRRTLERNELDEQARSISKQLRTLKKEAEYAKKIILNEKKLDQLIGALDRSKEAIYRQSIDAYENNISMIQDQHLKFTNKALEKGNGFENRLSNQVQTQSNRDLSTHRQSYEPGYRMSQDPKIRYSQEPNIQSNNDYSQVFSDRGTQQLQYLNKDQSSKALRSNASVSSIHEQNDNSQITHNLLSEDTQHHFNVPLRQKMQNLNQQKRYSFSNLQNIYNGSQIENGQEQLFMPTPTTGYQNSKNMSIVSKSENKQADSKRFKVSSFEKPQISNRNLNNLYAYAQRKENNQQQLQQQMFHVDYRFTPHHNQSITTIHNQSSNISYQNTYAGDYFEKLTKRSQEGGGISSRSISQRNNNHNQSVREGGTIKQKSCKFSALRIKGVDKNKNCHFKIFLPAGDYPSWSYYDCLINTSDSLPVHQFLDKLLRHAKINKIDRARYYLQIERDNQQQFVLNMEEDINTILGQNPQYWPINLHLKQQTQN